jgi:quercetin dioxygenase-like cupin family protein
MTIRYPHTIKNCIGETIIFKGIEKTENGDRAIAENFVTPGNGPIMHTHWLQDEVFTVVKGSLGYEIKGQPKQYAKEGETVVFKRGVAHRFWNAGEDILHCKGYVEPANTIVFFLSSIFDAQNKSGKAEPEKFDAAYLLTRYSSEYDLTELPGFVKKIILPVTYFFGKLLGKYPHFKDAPEPVKAV